MIGMPEGTERAASDDACHGRRTASYIDVTPTPKKDADRNRKLSDKSPLRTTVHGEKKYGFELQGSMQ
jgi:hypothetical protein